MPRHSEPSANYVLGSLLGDMLGRAEVITESTRVFAGYAGRQPDILVTAPGRSPVVVEAEYLPAVTAEAEAQSRLGLSVTGENRPIEAAIALRYPAEIPEASNLSDALQAARLEYCICYEDGARFPTAGWLHGSAADLSDLIRLVSLPQREVERAAESLQGGIDRAAAVLDEMAKRESEVPAAIASLLGMPDVPQTRKMAGAIIANALIFHERIAGMHPEIKSLHRLTEPTAQVAILGAWNEILEINYYPIFILAKDILMQLPSGAAARILSVLRATAQSVEEGGVTNAHDLTGRVFQRLIADRKYLATFYTLPASAAQLARLAVAKLEEVDWADKEAIGKLRVGDFACGTGALLSAVYEQIAARHEQAGGGDPAKLHRAMLEEVLYGCDVMPSAVHITAATLSGIQPNESFGQSHIYTMPYGRQEDGSVKIGSLELLQSSAAMTLFNTTDPALRTGSAGEETAAQVLVEVPDAGFDLVIMNPPFTRATNHGGVHSNVVNPAFAAFGATKADMDDMGKRMRDLGQKSCYDGKAGTASAFTALAHRKLKPGGVLAFVLPLSVSAGTSWAKFRQLLAADYEGLEVLSIAANGKDMSFSSDTGMAECLVIARKRRNAPGQSNVSTTGRFTSLTSRPQGGIQARELARSAAVAASVRNIEEGPYGATPLQIGLEQMGEIATAQIP